MPKEYIEREAICEKCNNKNSCFPYPEMRAKCPVYKTSAADVAPVVHGEWVEYQMPHIICCSKCDWGTSVEEKFFNYCPNCGAEMDGGK
jgi:hypothetical protein